MMCLYCGHAEHARGVRCGAPNPQPNGKMKPCKCKAGAGWLESLGNAIGEALFGGNR